MNDKIVQLKSRSRHEIKIKEGDQEITWVLRSMPAYDLMKHFDLFTGLSQNIKMDTEHLTDTDIEFIKNKMLPIMEVLLPACSVDPPVTVDDNDIRLRQNEAIHIRDLGFGTIAELFSEITKLVGMSKDQVEARKNSPEPPTVKP